MGIQTKFLTLISILLMLVGGSAQAASPSPEELSLIHI